MTEQTTLPPPSPSHGGAVDEAPGIIRIPMLISGIFSCLAALAWLSGCITFFVAIPLGVLAVFEFMTFAKLSSPQWRQSIGTAKTIQILEICSILLGNVASMICGIIGLVNGGAAQRR